MPVVSSVKTENAIAAESGEDFRREPTLRIFPSGDLSIGFTQPKRQRTFQAAAATYTDPVTGDKKNLTPATDDEIESLGLFAMGLDAEGRTGQAFAALEAMERAASRHTGLSDVLKSHKISIEALESSDSKARAPRGTNGISPYGGRMLRSAAVIVADRWARPLLSFGTCTVPGLGQAELELVNEQWAEITRKFQQELRRELRRQDLPLDYFSCSEVQPKRWEYRGEIAPHLHFCIVARRSRHEAWRISYEWLEAVWGRILGGVLNRSIDCSAATELRQVKKSVGAEVAKYLSKGGEVLAEIRKAGRGGELPAAYWNMPFALRREIKSLVFYEQGGQAEVWLANWRYLSEIGLASIREVMITSDDQTRGPPRTFRGGFTGWLKCDALAALRNGDISSITEFLLQ